MQTATGAFVGGTLVSGLSDTASAQSGESWPQFGYDDARTGHAPGNTGPVANVAEQWRFVTEGAVGTSPTVVEDVLYAGSEDGNVYALETGSGDERWRFETEGPVVLSSPTVVDGTVYVGSYDDNVYALATGSGDERWRFETGGFVDSSPAVVDGTVYVGSFDGYVYALDAEAGGERWGFETGDAVVTSPTTADDTVYVGSQDDNVYALDAESGDERWRFETGRTVNSSPAVADGTVYVGNRGGDVYALDAESGDQRWRFATGEPVFSSPTTADDTVYVGSQDDNVYALDAGSGDVRWRFETGLGVESSPAVVDGTVYVGSYDGDVYALDAESGDQRWRFETGDGVRSSPAVLDGTVYVGSSDNSVYALTGDTPTPTPTSTPAPTTTSIATDTSGSPDDDTDTDDDASLPLLPVAGAAAAAGAGGLWYWRNNGEDAAGTGSTAADPSDDGGGGPVRRGTQRASEVSESGSDDTGPTPDAVTDPLDRGDDHREAATEHAEAGEYDRALSALDDAREAYREAREAAGESEAVDGEGIEDRLATLDDRRREVRRERLASRHDAVRDDLDRAGSLVETDPETARRQLMDLEDDIGDLASRAAGRGFDDLADRAATLESERVDLLAQTERAGHEGPPESIPEAPDVTVDYEALADEEPIGGGGNADVTRATLPTPEGDVALAIKRPRMQGTLHTDAVERLMQEAETWDKLDDHDHVVGVIDYGAEPLPWIAMEYMDAGHLGERAGGLDFEQALWTAISITKGVRHAHRRGVAHLDLKPANVLFRGVEGAWDVPKVADWGLSKHLLDHSKSVEGLSPQYAAPEQFDTDRGAADDLTDVYQLGAVLYELFTGEPPFDGSPAEAMHRVLHEEPTPPSEVAGLPPALDDVLLTALEKERSDRYDGVLLLREALQGLR
ncbi:PQQ-binding-like beta-propeller repeat protein [Haloplanus salinarum]|uniref:outer membrane protein assembly factor BamB family protein n=1 Tax=Haloplanus salinarum TaxID=1912324 RepID=UPI00214BC689|nr:PQQ-binding-like beta-propeller repeat protein [Haloplanus salinarum]